MEHRWLAIIVGTLAIYLLIHAGVLGWGLYAFHDAFRSPPLLGKPLTDEERELSRTLVTALAVFAMLGTVSLVAAVAIWHRARWAQPLWLATGAATLIAVAWAMYAWEAEWTRYIYEVAVVGVSWWYMWRLRSKGRRET